MRRALLRYLDRQRRSRRVKYIAGCFTTRLWAGARGGTGERSDLHRLVLCYNPLAEQNPRRGALLASTVASTLGVQPPWIRRTTRVRAAGERKRRNFPPNTTVQLREDDSMSAARAAQLRLWCASGTRPSSLCYCRCHRGLGPALGAELNWKKQEATDATAAAQPQPTRPGKPTAFR